jgi:predicted DNA-binding transcriptional regulator AlpA
MEDHDMLVTTKKGRRPKAQVPPPAAANINLTDDRLVATAEAARLLGLSQKCLREWRCDRTGPAALKMGSGQRARVFYRLSSLEAWCRTNLTTLDEARVERARKTTGGSATGGQS